MDRNIISIALLITIFSFFIPGCILPISANSAYPINIYVILPMFTILVVVLQHQYIINKLKFLFKNTPFRYLVYFVIWLILSTFVLLLLEKIRLLTFYHIAVDIFPRMFISYFVAAIFIPKFLSLKQCIKFLLLIYSFLLLWGVFQYIGDKYEIGFIQNCVNCLSNWKEVMQNVTEMKDDTSGKTRIRSVFHEPGAFAGIIFMMLPVIYQFCRTKYKIFKNNYINFFVKRGLLPLAWFCLLLTQSPIYLIFSLIFTFIYFYKDICYFVKKHCLKIFFAIFIIISPFFIFWDQLLGLMQQTYIARIINTLHNLTNLEGLIFVEPSLATRLEFLVTQLQLWTHNPIIGYGFDSMQAHIYDQYMRTPFPLTPEIQLSIYNYLVGETKFVMTGKLTITQLLVETGLIGTVIYGLFLCKSIKILHKISGMFTGIEKDFAIALIYMYMQFICLCWYNNTLWMLMSNFYYGLTASYISVYLSRCKKAKQQGEGHAAADINNYSKL